MKVTFLSLYNQCCPRAEVKLRIKKHFTSWISQTSILVGFSISAKISHMLNENRLEKLVSPVKRSACHYASALQNFARRHFSNVNEVTIVFHKKEILKRGRLNKKF